MSWPAISVLAEQVASGKVSATENVKKALQKARDNSKYQAIISYLDDAALNRAEEIDLAVSAHKPVGRLAGVPFIAKDNFLVFGAETTAASNMLKGYTASYQSTVIEKLEAEGAICIAKANLDAFAHGGSTENSDFFVTKNPYDETRVAGGSSGGSAAAVALEIVPFALGSDTGGSIREPASFCGVVGYKPTYGLVSRSGVVAMASSTDVIGPFARNVDDAALILDIISGKDALDSTTIDRDDRDMSRLPDFAIKGKKFGLIKEYLGEGIDKDVKKAILESVDLLKRNGAIVEEVSLPSVELALAVYYVIVPAEVSSNLSRYDGQRYQYSDLTAKTLEESYLHSRSKGFGAEAKRRIMIGTHVLSSGYYDAYYKKAQTVRTKLIEEFKQTFLSYDFLIGPVVPETAFKIGQNSDDPLKMYLIDIMTVSANLVGVPSISLPIGNIDGLPVGLQIMANQRKDFELLSVSKKIEELTGATKK
jgi:aspartyl-tRNA(Asn)/glutamyl-tRNA(Gln) amidotransferase subunit A